MSQIGSIHEDCVDYDFQPLTKAEQESYMASQGKSEALNEKQEVTKDEYN